MDKMLNILVAIDKSISNINFIRKLCSLGDEIESITYYTRIGVTNLVESIAAANSKVDSTFDA